MKGAGKNPAGKGAGDRGKPRAYGKRPICVAGHFGEFLQGRLGPDGPVVLITLPCPALGVRLLRGPDGDGAGPAGIWPRAPGERALRARLFAALGRRQIRRARWVLRSSLPPGGGAGASTAALVALARAASRGNDEGRMARIARACLAAEGAVDPLMLDHPGRVLWASRRATIMARFGALPGLTILGGLYGPPRRTDPLDSDFPDIADLVGQWPEALRKPEALAALASESARRTLAHRGPPGDPTERLAQLTGALGFAIAHTGAARALIFARGAVPAAAPQQARAAGLRGVIQFEPEP